MKITEVSYYVTQNTGNYENIKFGVTVSQENGEAFEQLLEEAKTTVHKTVIDMLAERHLVEELERESRKLKSRIVDLERLFAAAKSRWEKAKQSWETLKKFADSNGFEVMPFPEDPFWMKPQQEPDEFEIDIDDIPM